MPVNLLCDKRIYDVQHEIVYWQPGHSFIPQNPFWAGINPSFWLDDKNFHLRQLHFMLERNECVGIGIIPDFFNELFRINDYEELIALNSELILKHKKYLYIYYSEKFLHETKKIVEKAKHEVFVGGFNGDMDLFNEWNRKNHVYFSFGPELMGINENAHYALRHCNSSKIFLQTGFSDISIKYLIKKACRLLGIEEEILKNKILFNFKERFDF